MNYKEYGCVMVTAVRFRYVIFCKKCRRELIQIRCILRNFIRHQIKNTSIYRSIAKLWPSSRYSIPAGPIHISIVFHFLLIKRPLGHWEAIGREYTGHCRYYCDSSVRNWDNCFAIVKWHDEMTCVKKSNWCRASASTFNVNYKLY